MGENPFAISPPSTTFSPPRRCGRWTERHAHDRIVAAVRAELAELREHISKGLSIDGRSDAESVAARAAERLERESRPQLRPVINATGVVLHTNLGRAPMAEAAARAAYDAARGYLNLELDLETGKRSSRQNAVREWVCRLTGAESATAVNNCAAATVIVLRAVAAGQGGDRLARPADRDRRQFPHPRNHGGERGRAARGRHDQHHAAWPTTNAPSARPPAP